jgi:MFS family permease
MAFSLAFILLPPLSSEKIYALKTAPVKRGLLLKDKILVSLFSFRMVYTTCIGIVWGFLPVYANDQFNLSSSAVGLLVMLAVSVSGLIHIPMGMLADRSDKRFMVLAGGAAVTGAMFLMGYADSFAGLFAANVIFGIGGGVSMPAVMALAVMRGQSIEAMGTVMSLITVAHSLGMLMGSIFAGMIMDFFELKYAFFLGIFIMAAGTLQFFAGTKNSGLSARGRVEEKG